MSDSIWVCIKDIGSFKASTVVNVTDNNGKRVVSTGNIKSESFDWYSTMENFDIIGSNHIEIPYYESGKYAKIGNSINNLARGILGKPKVYRKGIKYIYFETDRSTIKKINLKIAAYIVSIPEEILLEFSGMLIRNLTDLSLLCEHKYTINIDYEIQKVHEIVAEIFKLSRSIYNEITKEEYNLVESKLIEFREQYNKDLKNSLEFVKMLN